MAHTSLPSVSLLGSLLFIQIAISHVDENGRLIVSMRRHEPHRKCNAFIQPRRGHTDSPRPVEGSSPSLTTSKNRLLFRGLPSARGWLLANPLPNDRGAPC